MSTCQNRGTRKNDAFLWHHPPKKNSQQGTLKHKHKHKYQHKHRLRIPLEQPRFWGSLTLRGTEAWKQAGLALTTMRKSALSILGAAACDHQALNGRKLQALDCAFPLKASVTRRSTREVEGTIPFAPQKGGNQFCWSDLPKKVGWDCSSAVPMERTGPLTMTHTRQFVFAPPRHRQEDHAGEVGQAAHHSGLSFF